VYQQGTVADLAGGRSRWMASIAMDSAENILVGYSTTGKIDGTEKQVTSAEPMENAYAGEQGARYELRPEDLLEADRRARAAGLDLIGIFHSHPDCDAYFSKTDLENSCPWYSFVVLSVKGGKFDHAASFLPNPDQTAAEKEELIWPKS